MSKNKTDIIRVLLGTGLFLCGIFALLIGFCGFVLLIRIYSDDEAISAFFPFITFLITVYCTYTGIGWVQKSSNYYEDYFDT